MDNVIDLSAYRKQKEIEEYDILKKAVDNIVEELGPQLHHSYFVEVPKGTFEYSDDIKLDSNIVLQQQYIFCIDVLEYVSSNLLDVGDVDLSNQADNLRTCISAKLEQLLN
jgi:hypothetical protein